MSIIGSIVGGIMGSGAANDAASVEERGAQQAQSTIQKNQANAVSGENQALSNITGLEQPYQTVGSTSANNLTSLLAKGFTAPNPNDVASTPEYQFALSQGTDAINKDAAARGTLMSGNTGKALEDYGQGLASQQYQQSYQDALNTYLTNYQSLLGGTDVGSNSTARLGGANLNIAGTNSQIDMNAANQIAQQINNAAAARAQGILGSNNAIQGMIGGITSNAIPTASSIAEGLQGGGGFSDVLSSLAGMA